MGKARPANEHPVACATEVVDREMADVLRTKTPAERLAISYGLWRHADRTLRACLRAQHSDWTSDQIDHEAARRLASGSW